MDEKTGTMLPMTRPRPGGGVRLLVAILFLSVWGFLFLAFQPFYGSVTDWEGDWTLVDKQFNSPAETTKKLVPFEAHIMSKCPDARDCLREMVLPAMQRVGNKVDFTLSFIGT